MALLNFKQLGHGDNIILIHGLFGSLENLNMVARTLAKTYCVTSVDVRNHGSSFHENNMAYDVLAHDVIKVLDHLQIDKSHILGHSMGGKIAMQLALSYPQRVNKLIVADIAPVAYPPHHNTIIAGLQAIDLNSVTKRKDADIQLSKYVENTGVRQFLLRNLVANQAGIYQFRCNLDYINNNYSQIMQGADIDINKGKMFIGDTLFIKGDLSDYILPEHRETIIKFFPNSRAKIIQGAGHWLHAEKSVVFNKIVTDFLAQKAFSTE